MRSARAVICIVLFAAFFALPALSLPNGFFGKSQSLAQTPTPAQAPVTNPFIVPNVDPNVPRNQHTFTQAVTIEVLSAVICQITGIDPIDPALGCLGINPQTRKLGLVGPQLDEQGNLELGGMLGTTTHLIAATYQQPATSGVYSEYLADNFGIVKKAHAQETSYGFNGLKPILKLWEAVRNIAYILLTLAFIFIGLGVMLRVKIDPRTVMTIQNQIPKVIIAIILITFSYAIAAVMLDLMWVTTYAGVNVLSDHYPKPGESLAQKANKDIINNPLTFTNQIFETGKNGPFGNGVFHITQDVSNNVGEMLRQIVKSLLNVDEGEKCFGGLSGLLPGGDKLVNFSACAAGLIAFLASITLKLVILVVTMVTLFKIWFNLLKAYIYTILYVIVSPIMIAFGLLPTKPLGFENWLRRLFVNVAVFPLTAFLIVGARLLMDIYNTDASLFVPPLVGNPNAVNFGTLLAFGALIITPHIQVILQEKMGVKGIGSPGLIAAGLAGGAAVVGAPVSRAMKHLNRRDNRGNAAGMLSVGKEKLGDSFFNVFAKRGVKRAAVKVHERELRRSGETYHMSARGIKDKARQDVEKLTPEQRVKEAENRRIWLNRPKNGKKKPDDGDEKKGPAPAGGGPKPTPSGGGRPSSPSVIPSPTSSAPKEPKKEAHVGGDTASQHGNQTAQVLNVTAGTVNMKGGEKSKGLISEKTDEYIKRLKDVGKKGSATANKAKIEVKIQDALKEEDHESLAARTDSDWEHTIEKAHNEVEQEEKDKGTAK